MEAILTTPQVNTAALEKLFLELAATGPNAVVQGAMIPLGTSATVVTSSKSVKPAVTTPPRICAVTIMRYLDWVGLRLDAAHATATAP